MSEELREWEVPEGCAPDEPFDEPLFGEAQPVMNADGLFPCPFCGSEFTQVHYMGGKWQEPSAFSSGYRGECCDCGVTTAAFYTEAEAAVAWNTRAERTHRSKRTCRFMPFKAENERGLCSECSALMYESDCYCPHCGARVVDEKVVEE